MPIISGDDSDFGRLVVEEFKRRAQRVIDLGQADPDADDDAEVDPAAVQKVDTERRGTNRFSVVQPPLPDGKPVS